MRPVSFLLGTIFGAIFLSSVVYAWTGPASAPPNGNVSAPINVGSTDQVKNGGLSLNALAVFGNAILSGTLPYLNFGSTVGVNGYGFRDNGGTMEYKNSGGAWSSLSGGGGVPSGAVMAFNLASCPSGWTALIGATGRVIVGVGSNGTNSYTLGSSGGSDSQTLTVAQLPPHSFSYYDNYPGGPFTWSGWGGGQSSIVSESRQTNTVGSGAPVDVRQAYYALLYCQKN